MNTSAHKTDQLVYVVICKDDDRYVLATRQLYADKDQAYLRMQKVVKSREPLILELSAKELLTLQPPR